MFVADIRRILTKRLFFISIILGVLLILRPLLDSLLFTEIGEGSISQILSVPFALSDFTPFAAIFCVLPFADSFCEDLYTNYITFVAARVGKRKYVVTRAVTVMISGGMVMAIIVAITIVFCSMLSTSPDTPENTMFMRNSIWYKSGLMFKFGGFFYLALRVVFAYLFGNVWSLVGLVVSTVTTNKYAVLIVPFIIYELTWFILEGSKFNPVYLLRCDSEYIPSMGFVFIYQLLVIVVLFIFSVVGMNRKAFQ